MCIAFSENTERNWVELKEAHCEIYSRVAQEERKGRAGG